MENSEILTFLNEHYPISFTNVELFRDSGSTAYIVSSNN